MASPPAKRQRTEDAPITRSEIWRSDGSVVLQAANTQFRVHWSVLVLHSSVFSGMQGLPQPDDQPTVEGCPVVELSDDPQDVEYLLKALYIPTFHCQKKLPLAVIGAFIRLGRKYEFKDLFDSAVARLTSEYPATLEKYDILPPGFTVTQDDTPSSLSPLTTFMSPLHWKRQTAVQAVAKNLPPKHILVRFIHQRFRVSLDEEPQAVLSQFDNEPHWTPIAKYPPFPHNYPPSMPVMRDADLVCTAFTPGSNAVIEWLGDALIRTAAVACVWNQARDCDDHQNNTTIAYLCSEPFLAHLAIFYGLHLHEHSEGQPRVIPSMARMCDTFESLVGAVASDTADNSDPHRGYLAALDWVQDLFDPWVAALCTPADSYKAPRISSVARRMYESCLRKFGSVPIASMGPPVVDAQGLVYGSEAPSVADEHRDWMAEILGPRPNWRNIDAMGISFPTDYPPAPPSLAAVNINTLTTVFTDVLYRIHIGGGATSNERYRTLGHDICRLAVTALATAQLPTAAPGLLNEVRLECMEADLLARLGLLLRLDRYLRVLRPATADSADVYPRESADVFYAVVAVVYLEYGCAELLQWLDKLFSPWIIAAGDGTLRQSVAAEKTRQSRVLDEVLGRKLRQELRGKSSTRQQYATTVPSRKRRVVRARVAGRSDRYRVTTA